MSLRQRGQRASEATDEGGHYAGAGVGGGGGGGGGVYQQPPPPPRSRSDNSAASPGGGGGYGYYGGGGAGAGGGYAVPTATSPPYGRSPSASSNHSSPYVRTPSASSNHSSASYGTPVLHSPTVAQQPPYPSTAPPAYNYGYGGAAGGGTAGPAPRVLDGSSGFGGNAPGPGGHHHPAGSVGIGIGIPPPPPKSSTRAANPYKKPKSSSGYGLKHFVMSLLAITLLVLAGCAFHFRSVMKATVTELEEARELLERRQRQERNAYERSGGRYGHGGRQNKANADSEKKKTDADPRADLEREVAALRIEVESKKKSHEEIREKEADTKAQLAELQNRRQDLLKAVDHARFDLEDASQETAKYKAMVDGLEEIDAYMKRREGALWNRIDALERKIGRESWREAAEWFGPGPHKVEIELEYPRVTEPESDPSTWPQVRGKFVIEMAPLDLMPHAVNLFLQQVHHGLWYGCRVVSNAPHILRLGPSYRDEDRAVDSGATHYDHFRERGFDKVSYQEYSKDYPHVQWTVGITGRPGGPDFFVNKLDNSLIHGPGGQANEQDLHNEADPCFGRVTEGIDILEEIGRIPTDPENGDAVKYSVVIVGARVFVPNENPAEGWRIINAGEKWDTSDGIVPMADGHHYV